MNEVEILKQEIQELRCLVSYYRDTLAYVADKAEEDAGHAAAAALNALEITYGEE